MVESNPSPADDRAVKAARFKFLVVVALFVLPVGSAMYLHFTGWRPGSTMNHGTLVSPARPAPDMEFIAAKSNPVSQNVFEKKWNLVMAVSAGCDDACLKNLYATRQIHVGQGKHQHRVRRILIHGGTLEQPGMLAKKYPDLVVIQANPSVFDQLKNWFALEGAPDVLNGQRVYMVDPLGNYMMYYAPGFEPKGMRKDLARLLRVSRIG